MIKLIKCSIGCKLVDHQEVLKKFDSAKEGDEYIKRLKASIIDEFMETERRPITKVTLTDGMELHQTFGSMKYVIPKHNERPYVLLRRTNGKTAKYFNLRSIEY